MLASASGAHADPVIEGRLPDELLYKRLRSAPLRPDRAGRVVRAARAAQEAARAKRGADLVVGGGRGSCGPTARFDALVGARPVPTARTLCGPTVSSPAKQASVMAIQSNLRAWVGSARCRCFSANARGLRPLRKPAILSPKVLDPKDFAWKSATVQRLRRRRAAAETIVARRTKGARATAGARSARQRRFERGRSPARSPTKTWRRHQPDRGGDGHGRVSPNERALGRERSRESESSCARPRERFPTAWARARCGSPRTAGCTP